MKFDYEGKVWGGPVVKVSPFYIQGLKLKYTLEDLKNVKGRVIDIGCGGGNMAKAIKLNRADLTVYGTDVSKFAIKNANKNPQNVKFSVAPAEKTNFPKNYFDMVTMYDVLEHVEDPIKVLKEVRRILKPNGKFHLFMPLDRQTGTIYEYLYKLNWQSKNKFTGHLVAYTDKTAVALYKKGGFKVSKKRFTFHLVMSFFDFLYFTILDKFNLKPKASIEGEIKNHSGSLLFNLFNLFYRLVIAISFFESSLLKDLPGGGADYLLKKK